MVRRIAVIGAGWAGLSAAIHASRAGHNVHVFEMADRGGGRARTDHTSAGRFDNGPHILIGAYTCTLDLLRTVGIDDHQAFERTPLYLVNPSGRGLELGDGRPVIAFVRGVLAHRGWPLAHRISLLGHAARWKLTGFACAPELSVADLCTGLAATARHELVEPLCVAALNTDAQTASGSVWLTVLHDALFQGPGGSDLMLPRVPLHSLLPDAAHAWLASRGVEFAWRHQVRSIARHGRKWIVDGLEWDAVIVATPAREAARLIRPLNPAWSEVADALQHEPILTAWLHDPALRWPRPMLSLGTGPDLPAQFGFDLGALGHRPATFAFVASAAGRWIDQGLDRAAEKILGQARQAFPGSFSGSRALVHVAAERRATFVCCPGVRRPRPAIAPGLAAAGDYVQGRYPSTLEGAVRSGRIAVTEVLAGEPASV